MAGVKHTTAADGTFTAQGASAWDAEHTLSDVAADTSLQAALSVIGVNSAQMTSADNAISAAVAALSAQHTSLAASVAGALSAIGANSAQMTSADNAISAAVAAVSTRVTSVMSAVSVESAARAAADTSLDGRITSVMSAVSVESAARAAADTSLAGRIGSVMSAVSVESAARAAADTSLDGRITSVMSAISTLTLDQLANVSVPSPADTNVLMWNSVQGQWVASAGGGAGSVTSAEVADIASALSVRIDSVISAVSNYASVASNAASAASNYASACSHYASVASNAASVASAAAAAAGGRASQSSVLDAAIVLSATVPTSIFTFSVSAGAAYNFEYYFVGATGASGVAAKFDLSCDVAGVSNVFFAEWVFPVAPGAPTTMQQGPGVTVGFTTASATGTTRRAIARARGTAFASANGIIVLKAASQSAGGTSASAVVLHPGCNGLMWKVG